MKTIGILTSGGDSPGMNAAVVSVWRCAKLHGMRVVGFKRGYSGLLALSEDSSAMEELSLETILDIADQRGAYLRTARCEEFLLPEAQHKAAQALTDNDIDALVVIGGDGSFRGAIDLCKLKIPCVVIPGTIDNDLGYTEASLGYDTAVNVCVEAVRSIRATSRSHDRVAVIQVMGRDAGDIAMRTAVATGAEMVVVPEMEWGLTELADRLKGLIKEGNTRSTLIISEHCWHRMKEYDWGKLINDSINKDKKSKKRMVAPGEPMNAERLAEILEILCPGVVARATVVGYTQRGAIPSAFDSVFAFEAGRKAIELLKDGDSNKAIGIRNGRIFDIPIKEALNTPKGFDEILYKLINEL